MFLYSSKYRVCILSVFLFITPTVFSQEIAQKKAAAINVAEKKVEVSKKNITIDPQTYLTSLLDLADTYYAAQEYASARTTYWEYFLQSTRRGLYNEKNPRDLDVLMQHSMSSYYLGDYDECIEMFRGYLGQLESRGALDSKEIVALCWMSDSYIKKKDFVSAQIGIISIKERIKNNNIQDAYVLELAKYVEADLLVQTDPANAVDLLLSISNEGIDNTVDGILLVIAQYSLIANCAMRLSGFDLSIETYQKVIDIMEEYDLTKGSDYYESNYNLMLCLALNGKDVSSISSKLNRIIINNIHDNFPRMTDSQRISYWNRFNNWFFFFLPRLAGNKPIVGEDIVYRNAYTGLLVAKGLLLRSAISIQDFVSRSHDEELQEIQEQIEYVKKKIQKWQNSDSEEARQEIFNNKTNLDRLQQRLLSGIRQYDYMQDIYIDVDSVQKNLLKDDIAIEFIALDRDISTDDTNSHFIKEYFALTIKKDYAYPHLIKVCDSSEFPEDNSDVRTIYNSVWKPLEKELRGVKRIFFSPDASLYNLPIEHAIKPNGEFFCSTIDVFRLSSTRQLTQKQINSNNNNIMLFGNIDYYNSAGKAAKPSAYSDDIIPKIGKNNKGSSSRGAADIESSTFAELDYSKEEIYKIAEISSSNNYKIQIYEKENASEEIFKRQSGESPKVIIFSTHGYMISDKDSTCLIPIDDNEADAILEEDISLSKTGLVLSGANRILLQESLDGTENGFVSAREVSIMNLENTELVILSACETALGDVSSEGVFGLQRGFKKAGANSILMSLWKVDDEATCKLMTEFYSNWIGNKMTKHDALEAAKKTVRETKGWEDPKYWAAFILLDGLD